MSKSQPKTLLDAASPVLGAYDDLWPTLQRGQSGGCMHIKRVSVSDFRRFTKLEIEDIPPTAKLVLLAGPNGNGKSSLFDAFMKDLDRKTGRGGWDQSYHTKIVVPDHVP